MRNQLFGTAAAIGVVALAGCGLEGILSNQTHTDYDRPASAIHGTVAWSGFTAAGFNGLDGGGATLTPFLTNVTATTYDMRLPSAKYSMLRAQLRSGNVLVRALVPFIGEESIADGVNLDEKLLTEALIVEARLSQMGVSLKQLTPSAYLGTRLQIQNAMAQPGPTQDLMKMVKVILAKGDPSSGASDPDFFMVPEINADYSVKTSPLNGSYFLRNPLAYDPNDPNRDQRDTAAFDAKLVQVAKLYDPTGCADPNNVRVLFTVDFNKSALNGNGSSINPFLWATDKPGKSMFFVGWVHKESLAQDPKINALVGTSTPNQLPMYDDGTNGDEVAGDGIWTISFVLPKADAAGNVFRLGYKYTWGTRGAQWTGTEEWPGNSRIIQVEDLNGDGFVYRRDAFSDEATNKDRSNLNNGPHATGSVDWNTDVRGCGLPEARENKFVTSHVSSNGLTDDGLGITDASKCGKVWHTPKSLGPLKVACSQ
jgi:hypothetical protein